MIYQTQEEAVDSLVTTKAGDQLRNKAREADARKEESFQRSDTDGFLSQWASGVTAQKYRKEAELADQGNQDVFRVLLDKESNEVVAEKLFIFDDKFGPSTRSVWLVKRNGEDQWVTDPKKESPLNKKGLKTAWDVADAFVGTQSDNPLCKSQSLKDGNSNYFSIREFGSYK